MTSRFHGRLTTTAILLLGAATAACSWETPPEQRAAPGQSLRRPAPPVTAVTTPARVETLVSAPAVPVVDTRPRSFADGEQAYHARDYAEAFRVFAHYTSERPGNAWGHYMLGLSAWKVGEFARAESAFEEALRIDPTHVKSLVNLSRVLLDQGRPEDALERLAQAGAIDPESADVHRLIGRGAHAIGDASGAIDAYRRAITIDPRDGWSLNNLALVLIEQGRAAEALPFAARAVSIRSDVPVFQNNLGMALEHTGRFGAAAEAYAAALAADPAYVNAKRNLARVELVKEGPAAPFDLLAAAAGRDAGEEPGAVIATAP